MNTQLAERMDPATGEIVPLAEAPTSLAVQLAQAELNQAVTTARAFPRSIAAAVKNITALATLDEQTAEENVYALPRGGKAIRGPSVRLAEIIASQWGNCHVASRVVDVDRFNKVVIAEGVFHDLETGLKRTAQVQRRIVDKRGNLYNDDMITTAGNAAASIAMREAVLKGVPKAIWRQAYDMCEKVIAGDVKTLAERRAAAFKAFAAFGVTPEQMFAALEVEGVEDVGPDELVTLTAWRNQIRDNETTVEDLFPPVAKDQPAAKGGAGKKGTAGKLGDIADQGKAKAGDKAAESPATGKDGQDGETPAGGDKDAQAASSAAETGNAGDDKPAEISDEEREAAFQRGKTARQKGMSRKATPTEWREPGKEALLEAYLNGFDE